MENQLKLVFSTLLLGFGLSLFAGCAPPHTQQGVAKAVETTNELPPVSKPVDPIDYELVSTYQPTETSTADKSIRYEKARSQIETVQAVVLLNQVHMSKVVLVFDPATKTLTAKGNAEITNQKNTIATESAFDITGTAKNSESVVRLISKSATKELSSKTPVVSAQATCLGLDANDQPDCSRVIIDFFIIYKAKIYTEQMQIKNSSLKPTLIQAAPLLDNKKTEKDKSNSSNEKNDQPGNTTPPESPSGLQVEGTENSVPGRFEGQINNTDFYQVFENVEDVHTALKEIKMSSKPESKPEVKIETPAKPDTKPTIQPPVKKAEPAPHTDDDSDNPPEPVKPVEKPIEKPIAKPKDITNDISQTTQGTLRPKNQAIGFPNDGALKNATSLLSRQQLLNKNAFFEIVFPGLERYFATYEMSEMLGRLGDFLNKHYTKKLMISDISRARGGLLSPHLSHQIGMDADIAYPSTDEKVKFPVVVERGSRHFNSLAFSTEKTYELLKFAFAQNDLKIDRIFIDQNIKQNLCNYAKRKGELSGKDKTLVRGLFKNMEHVTGHGDHFHIRLKCTAAHPACRQNSYIENNGCE